MQRHHARHRHATAARLGPGNGRGALAHPTQSAGIRWSEARRVVEGYGILQPRVGVSLPAAPLRSWFVRLFGGDAGIDPYTRVVSDVYQDLFAEGSFIGKGIYDVDAFEQCCGAFPENAILSHDLLESAYARSGLLKSDVELYEEYPSSYSVDMSRRHRWIRGDWQIAWWLLPWVPGQAGCWQSRDQPDLRRYRGGRSSIIFAGASWLRRPMLLVLSGIPWLLSESHRRRASATLFVLASVVSAA